MKIVKLSYHYDWPLFRQSPQCLGEWGDYKFIIDKDLKECDFWIIYTEYGLETETVRCNPENIIFVPGECYNTSPRFSQQFLDQFGMLVTVQRELKHRNKKLLQNANPWFIGKSYDELKELGIPKKSKLISVISSNKAFTEGHRKRLEFVEKIKSHFGDQIDVFGRGIKDFDDKWDVIADYKYTIAIENDDCDDWVTEKFFDCLYARTLPFYYGCPNLEEIVNKDTFIRIDIHNLEQSIQTIEKAIQDDEFEKRKELLDAEALKSLDRDQFFPFFADILDTLGADISKKNITLRNQDQLIEKKLKNNFISRLKYFISKRK
jgi:hypothetical protein